MILSDVEKELSIESGVMVIIEKSTTPKRDRIPLFDILTVKISDTKIKDLVLIQFFNGRLMEVRFFPVDVNGFVQIIDGLSESKEIEIRPFTKVWILEGDYRGRTYVGWIDIRLEKQFLAWIKHYA